MTGTDTPQVAIVEVYLRPRQIVEQYNITERTVRRMIAAGKLDARKVGHGIYVTRESVDKLFEQAK